MCPIFVGSVDNFGRSDDDMIYIVEKLLFPLDGGSMPKSYKKSWTVSDNPFTANVADKSAFVLVGYKLRSM